MVVGVVHVQHVDPVEAEALEACVKRAHGAVVGEVEHGVHGRHVGEDRVRPARCVVGDEEATHLGGHDRIVTLTTGQTVTQPALRSPCP